MTYRLIEHQTAAEPLPADFDLTGLKAYLDEVWQSRFLFDEGPAEEGRSRSQPFLTFEYAGPNCGPRLRAGKHVGFVQYEGITIEILPKLFTVGQADVAFRHLLWWLSYCQRIRFPFTDLVSDSQPIEDFPEALIGYFARYVYDLVTTQPYHQYEEVTESLSFLRGRLNVTGYVAESLSRGLAHQLVCDYQPFLYNNRLNQIIKAVARRLGHLCRFSDTHRWLEKVLFTLDEVDDLPVTVRDCDSIHLNRFYHEYEVALDMCRFFLSDSYLSRQDAHQRHFCFLLPMDLIFEDFVAGVCGQHLSAGFKVQTQAPGWLARNAASGQSVFQIRNDMLLTHRESRQRIVVDTKYKRRDKAPSDAKQGISQTDLYQMVSYALRRDTRQVVLLYPCAYCREPQPDAHFTVESGLLAPQILQPLQPLHFRAVDLSVTGHSKAAMIERVIGQITNAFNQQAIMS